MMQYCTAIEIYNVSPVAQRWEYPVIDADADKIIAVVCDYLKVPIWRVLTQERKREICFARQLSMYFIKRATHMTYKSIGFKFPGSRGMPRDHTTVIHAIRTINDLMDSDPEIRKQVYSLQQVLVNT